MLIKNTKTLFGGLAGLCLAAGAASAQAPVNDDCAAATAIAGQATWSYDTTLATTDPANGDPANGVGQDIWFDWTADFTGDADMSLCGSGYDTKIAVFGAAGCPGAGPSIAYNDDACGLQSQVFVSGIVTGSIYAIQVGGFSSAAGVGSLTIAQAPPSACSLPDDAFEENDDCSMAVPMPDGSYTGLWARGDRNNPLKDSDFYSTTVQDGDTLTVDIYFSDAQADTDIYLWEAATCGTGTTLFYAGSVTDNEQAVWTNATGVDTAVIIEIWVWGAGTSECIVYDMDIVGGTPGVLGTQFCLGDGSDGGLCPCGNLPLVGSGEGCTNVSGVGAFISASGSASVSVDSLVLTVNQAAPSDFGIFVQNIAQNAGPAGFYNGLFCLAADSHLVRHYGPPAVQPTITDGLGMGVNAQPMTVGDYLGDTQPGVTVYYQFWGRDNGGPCGSGANFSSGLSLVWQP